MAGVESRYAEALVELASERGLLGDYGNALGLISDVYGGEADFRDFLLNPVVKADLKKDLVLKAFGGQLSPELLNFLYLLIDNKRICLLRGIAAEYRQMADRLGNVLKIEIISAEPLDSAQADGIKRIYGKEYGASSVRAELKTDPSLIGGVMVKIGDKVIDGTIKGRLEQIKASVMEA